MVTFCTVCGTSLPLADVLIKAGKELTSPDYRCPECGDFAAEEAHRARPGGDDFDVDELAGLVVRAGIEETRTAAELSTMFGSRAHSHAVAVAAPAPVDTEGDVVMPPDEDLLSKGPQPALPALPAVDEEVQEDLPTDLPAKVEEEPAEEEDDMDFIERPE